MPMRPVFGNEDHTASTGNNPVTGIKDQRLYTCRFCDTDQTRRQMVWRELARYVHKQMDYPERVLDPAAGLGEFITAVPVGERWGVDRVSNSGNTFAGVRMIVADIIDVDLPNEYFDGVFVSNFLEHLADQDAIGGVLGKLRTVMRHGGRIAIIGPNFRYCAKECFDCADHTVILSHVAVAEHLYAAGFEPVCVQPRCVPYSFRACCRHPLNSHESTYIPPSHGVCWANRFLVIARKSLCIPALKCLMGPAHIG